MVDADAVVKVYSGPYRVSGMESTNRYPFSRGFSSWIASGFSSMTTSHVSCGVKYAYSANYETDIETDISLFHFILFFSSVWISGFATLYWHWTIRKDPLFWHCPNYAMEIPFSTLSNKCLKPVLFGGASKTLPKSFSKPFDKKTTE